MTSLEIAATNELSDDAIVAVLVELCTANDSCHMVMCIISWIALVFMICGCISCPSMSDLYSTLRVTFIREMLFRD
jgi:hypothetical protein